MSKIKTIGRCKLFALMASLFCLQTALAVTPQDFLVFGNSTISLRPQLEILEQYNDNVYYTKGNTVSDFLTIFSPGVKLIAGDDMPGVNHVLLAYNMDQLIYLNQSDQNAMQHRLRTSTHYKWTRLTLEGNDRVQFLSSVLGAGFSVTTNAGANVIGVKVDRLVFSDSYRADYRLGQRTSVYVEGVHSAVDYQENIGLYDSRTISGTGGFEWQYSTRTRLFGEVYYGQTELERNTTNLVVAPGTTFVGGFLGARGDFTDKLKGKLKAGYAVSEFRNKGGVLATNLDAGASPVIETTITYLPTERMTVNLAYSRRQQVSVQFDRSAFVLDSVNLTLSQIIGSTGRLRAMLGGAYEVHAYDQSRAFRTRNDTLWRIDAGATWFFETWLSTRLQYSHENFQSDFAPVVDYSINRVTLSLAIGY